MNKNLDHQINDEADEGLFDEPDSLPRRKILYTRILKLPAERTENPYGIIGMALFDAGQLQKSLIPLKRATITNPQDAYAHIDLAKAFLKLEKEKEFFSCMKNAFSFSPDSWPLHDFLIKTLKEQDRLGNIKSFFQEIPGMLRNPKSLPFFYFACAKALARGNIYPQALEMFEKSIETDPTQRDSYSQYGMALYHEGLFEEAKVQCEHVLKLDPTNKAAFNNIAHINYCLGRVQKAFEEFEYIMENSLDVFTAYSNFLLVLYHLDKEEEVIDKYKNLLQPYTQSHGITLKRTYQEVLRITEIILQRDDIDEETKESNTKKLKGTNLVLSLFN